jgi:hypothetical protein
MPSQVPDDVAAIAERILEYLRAHPHAADTSEGIARWWLSDMTPAVSPERVELALRVLAELGQVEACTLPSGAVVYSKPRH